MKFLEIEKDSPRQRDSYVQLKVHCRFGKVIYTTNQIKTHIFKILMRFFFVDNFLFAIVFPALTCEAMYGQKLVTRYL